jgi:hypothetical protein
VARQRFKHELRSSLHEQDTAVDFRIVVAARRRTQMIAIVIANDDIMCLAGKPVTDFPMGVATPVAIAFLVSTVIVPPVIVVVPKNAITLFGPSRRATRRISQSHAGSVTNCE